MSRSWNEIWRDFERRPIDPPEAEHPFGSIKTGINAAYLATHAWKDRGANLQIERNLSGFYGPSLSRRSQ